MGAGERKNILEGYKKTSALCFYVRPLLSFEKRKKKQQKIKRWTEKLSRRQKRKRRERKKIECKSKIGKKLSSYCWLDASCFMEGSLGDWRNGREASNEFGMTSPLKSCCAPQVLHHLLVISIYLCMNDALLRSLPQKPSTERG